MHRLQTKEELTKFRGGLGLAHLLLAGNDTVPISVWCGQGTQCAECPTRFLFSVLLFLCLDII